MFQLSVSWGIAPSEFWEMTLPEWVEIYNHFTRDPKEEARKEWAKQADLTDDEWWELHGRK